MQITVKLTKEEIDKAIRDSISYKFEVKSNADINYILEDNKLIGVEVKCQDKKSSYYEDR